MFPKITEYLMNKITNEKHFFVLLFVGLITVFVSCNTANSITEVKSELIEVNKEPDENLLSTITPYKSKLSSELDEVIGYTELTLDKGKPESLLGNFLADLLIIEAEELINSSIDFCVINNGGIRSMIPKGEITRRKIFELMPFENEMVVLTLKAESTKELFDYIAQRGGMPISGFQLSVKPDDTYTAEINGKTIDYSRNYTVLTSDYLADGGGGMTFFADSLKKQIVGMKIRDAIILHIEKLHKLNKVIKPELDERIRYAK